MKRPQRAGLIAAGTGSRFKKAGFSQPKPMIKVGGRPLIGWALSQFRLAGLSKLSVIFNSVNCTPCSSYLSSEFPDFETDIKCKDTRTSAESFMDVLSRAEGDPILITTTDSIFRPGALAGLIDFASNLQDECMVLGVTSFIDDEKPLYVSMDDNGKIISLGGSSGSLVTNGVYLMPANALKMGHGHSFPALRNFLAFLLENGLKCRGFNMGPSIDVDRPEDIKEAERFISKLQG